MAWGTCAFDRAFWREFQIVYCGLVNWLTNMGQYLIVNIVYRVSFNAGVAQRASVKGKE
jgi:hypothetical protein